MLKNARGAKKYIGDIGVGNNFHFKYFWTMEGAKVAFPMSLWKDVKGHWKGPKKLVFGTTMQTRKDAKPGGGVPTPCRMSRDVGGVGKV